MFKDLGPMGKLGAIIIGIILIGTLAVSCKSYYTPREVTAVIVDKERVCGNAECKYLIFTDNGTYELTDSIIAGRWNSSDIYGGIERGEKYRFKVYGFRFGPTSSYPNIKNDPVKVG